MTQSFDPAALLSDRANAADEGAIIRMTQRTRELRAKGRDVVALTLGEPDFDTPENIRDAAKAALDAGFTHYAPVAGIVELREAIAAKLKTENALTYPASGVVVAKDSSGNYVAATQTCTHEGNKQITLKNNEWYCTAHGARFSLSGSGLNSEGSKGLTIYKTALTGTTLRVYS